MKHSCIYRSAVKGGGVIMDKVWKRTGLCFSMAKEYEGLKSTQRSQSLVSLGSSDNTSCLRVVLALCGTFSAHCRWM